jgi:hypothetical protein
MLPPAMKLKKLIKENDVKPTYTKEKLDIDLTKCEKNIAKLQKVILNHDNELKLKEIELEQLKLELTQLNDLKNYTH